VSERSAAVDSGTAPGSPFRGLRAFSASDTDAALFFGRDRDQELIVANLLASRLTILYGQSGIGKSSLLCAGIVNRLRQPEGPDADSRVVVVYVSQWHGEPAAAVLDRLHEETRRLTGEELGPPDRDQPLDGALEWWAQRLDAPLLLVLDQFEQYFLHHPPARTRPFDRALAAAIQNSGLRLGVLISLREDTLAGMDRFKPYMPSLFANRMRLRGLDEAAALEAICRPVERYNELRAAEPPIQLEPGLAPEVVRQLQELVAPLARGGGAPSAPPDAPPEGARPIEPAHLQLVMQALWEDEQRSGSGALRKTTLEAMGGCKQIIRSHVAASLATLPASERATTANAIYYLITPSGAKVAHTAGDLAGYVHAPPARVQATLEHLCEVRLMRPLPPSEGSLERRYEVFHDLLADPLLEWRASFEAQRLAARMRWALAALAAAVAAVLAIVAYNTNPAPLRKLELGSIDARFAVRGNVAPDRDMVIVTIDRRTLDALNHGEFGNTLRPYIAKLFDLILTGAPRVIADDLDFRKPGHERSLLAAIKRADGRIVLVSEEFNGSGEVPLFGYEEEHGATELLEELNHAQAAFGGFPLDPGRVYRRMQYAAPSVEGERENRLPTFAVAVARIAEGHSIPHFAGTPLIDYHGPPGTFPHVSMLDVLRGRVRPSAFAGKIVVVGATVGKDLHRTPFTSRPTMPGVEIQANAISSVRRGLALRSVSPALASLLIVVLSLTALLGATVRWWIATASFIAVAGAYLVLVQVLFDAGVYLPLVAPMLALVLAGAGTLLARAFLARQVHARR
jgi:CHASE2 domain-containing sensor protein